MATSQTFLSYSPPVSTLVEDSAVRLFLGLIHFPVCFLFCLIQKLEEQIFKIRLSVLILTDWFVPPNFVSGLHSASHVHSEIHCHNLHHHPLPPPHPPKKTLQGTYILYTSLSNHTIFHPTLPRLLGHYTPPSIPWPACYNGQPLTVLINILTSAWPSAKCPALDCSTISLRDGTLGIQSFLEKIVVNPCCPTAKSCYLTCLDTQCYSTVLSTSLIAFPWVSHYLSALH